MQFVMFAVYDRPRDYPADIVCRRWVVENGVVTPDLNLYYRAASISAMETYLAQQALTEIRNDGDPDPAIHSVWMLKETRMRIEPNPVNDEIAQLMGFHWRTAPSGCRFLCPPNTPEGCELVGVREGYMDEVFPIATGSEPVCSDYNRYVPRYEEDDGTALRLVAYLARLVQVHAVAVTAGTDSVLSCEVQYGPTQCRRGRHMYLAKAITAAALPCLRDIARGPLYNPQAPESPDGADE